MLDFLVKSNDFIQITVQSTDNDWIEIILLYKVRTKNYVYVNTADVGFHEDMMLYDMIKVIFKEFGIYGGKWDTVSYTNTSRLRDDSSDVDRLIYYILTKHIPFSLFVDKSGLFVLDVDVIGTNLFVKTNNPRTGLDKAVKLSKGKHDATFGNMYKE